ncbi:multidrug efflux MFS transporter [Lactococcus allomyrinae]|uniref:MFS transporter n=1 Tax=Lactococcus allomyrinae TaxID=2419773 RepID=A0A387BMG2_9LACT|nr:multidrug efflux MFS transporter [Lactococcus allomyrinae]AYF99720.1 MFS transporter [Lactococcus allomyrinae]
MSLTKTVNWKRNLFITWIGCFIVGSSFSLVMPFLPLYIQGLGVRGGNVELYSGLAFSLTALASGLVAPVWGRLADEHGRKPMMVRASIAMTICMSGIAFVDHFGGVWALLALRLLMGFFSGYIPNSTAMIASQAPKEKSGYALGTLATAMVSGTLIGPSLGGLMAQWFGMANVFLIVGVLLALATLLTIFFVHENFEPIPKGKMLSSKEIIARVSNKQILFGLLVTTFIIQITSQSIEPFVTLYIKTLTTNTTNLMFISGLIVSAVGLSAMLSSSFLGRIGDKYGSHRLILIGLVFTFVIYLPMAMVNSPLQLGILRFLLGFGTGALMPSVNSLLSKITPKEGVSRIFAYAQMCSNLGMVTGPLVGSAIAGYISYRAAIVGTSLFVVVNIVWSFINFRKYLHKRSIME